MSDRLFIGCYPTGLVYADRKREVAGDYRRLAYLNYGTLKLELEKRVPKELREEICQHASKVSERAGENYPIAGNATVVLGETMLRERLAACVKEFRDEMEEIAAEGGLPVLRVFALWRIYSNLCFDQSALLSEFRSWNAETLGLHKKLVRAFLDGRGELEDESEFYLQMDKLGIRRKRAAELLKESL